MKNPTPKKKTPIDFALESDYIEEMEKKYKQKKLVGNGAMKCRNSKSEEDI